MSVVASTGPPVSWRLVGCTRAAVLVILVLSSAWSVFLAILNGAPSATANYLMNTTRYDDGDFWQLADSDATVRTAAVAGLGTVATVYAYLVVRIVRPPRQYAKHTTPGPSVKRPPGVTHRLLQSFGPTAQQAVHDLTAARRELVHQRGRYRKLWNLIIEIPELVFQTLSLHNLLANGLSTQIITAYVAAMVVNCVYCFYHIVIAWKRHAFHEMVGDALLDVVFAIAFPAATLLHTVHEFRGGLRWMAIRELYFPAQPYERRSRLVCDARQINNFTLAFDSLRVSDAVDLVVTVGFHLLTCLRWRRIVLTLQRAQQQSRRRIVTTPSATVSEAPQPTTGITSHSIIPTHKPTDDDVVLTAMDKSPLASYPVVVPHRVVPVYVGFLFLVFGALVVLYTTTAIAESAAACMDVEGCALYAYQWFPGAPAMACPCLVFLRGTLTDNSSVRSIDELTNVAPALALAAEAGTLRTIQLMNVAVQGSLPANVKGCTALRHLILLNTDFEVLPSAWSRTFQNLQYLHITAGANSGGLDSVPPRFFSSMHSLRTLTLEGHRWLASLDSLHGLVALETLYISGTWLLPRLPVLSDTPRLHTLVLVDNQWLQSLPDLEPIQSSLHALFVRLSPLCCSGFLDVGGVCRTIDSTCSAFAAGVVEYSCYPSAEDMANDPTLVLDDDAADRFPLISNASRAVLQPFLDRRTVCDPARERPTPIKRAPFQSACQGVWYRQCSQGICYSFTLDSPQCLNDSAVIAMRKDLIRAGNQCDLVEEAWLGCH